MNTRRWSVIRTWLLLAAVTVPAARAQVAPGKLDPDGLTIESIKAAMPEYFHSYGGRGGAQPADIPDIFGPGKVLTVGNVFMKVTNWGHVGNLFQQFSSDPSMQWPGASGIEYLSSVRLAVGAVNPTATDPNAIRRVSYLLEWRPLSLLPEDKIYRAYDGIINGSRYVNDDGDFVDDPIFGRVENIDEDFLDGHDNDGDGKIDEDHGAIGQMTYSWVMRDDTPQAVNATFNEKHVPLGVECKQLAWAYSIPGFTDFNVVDYTLRNDSGHELDSLFVGWLVDMDCGPLVKTNYFSDDYDIPGYPQGDFAVRLDDNDARRQVPPANINMEAGNFKKGVALCDSLRFHVSGFSIADDDGDEHRTTGIPSFMLINYDKDPTGVNGPRTVGFHSFRSFTAGTPYQQGGNPIIDQQRFEFMSAGENIDHTIVDERGTENRMIIAAPGDQKGDFVEWVSVGPWLKVKDQEELHITIALGVKAGTLRQAYGYAADYQKYQAGILSQDALRKKYASLDNAIAAHVASEGIWEQRPGFPVGDQPGREKRRKQDKGAPPIFLQDCRDELSERPRQVTDLAYTWFDDDCDYCTGVYDFSRGVGLFHHTWAAEAPPPNPNTNLSTKYNFSENPLRVVAPGGDRTIALAWDNLSEFTPDPKTLWFDCRGYRIWKVANWQRPVGSPGPAEDDWSLVGEYRLFKYRNPTTGLAVLNNLVDSLGSGGVVYKICPKLYVPNYRDPATGLVGAAVVPICLKEGDIWDRQNADVIHPDPNVQCTGYPSCTQTPGCEVGSRPCLPASVIGYPVGRYRYLDREVKNGFSYFYSVTAFDSTGDPDSGGKVELEGRRSAVEAEGVIPQAGTRTGRKVWVVPNPYRGYANIRSRPSSWDMIPNASDPTGTHIDFLGMPPGLWTLRIFTVSGDLVAVIHSDDPVNESLRGVITDDAGAVRRGSNQQQDTANDGQASWNLISRNGQDVVSGIYMFTVESSQGTQRGHFVIIR